MPDPSIHVRVDTQYLAAQSDPASQRYAFSYHITITNRSDEVVTLRTRHWIITDSNGERQEVIGDGVVGQTPTLQPGQSFDYHSGTLLPTPVGTMEGAYGLVTDSGSSVTAPIAPFLLAVPGTLN